MDQHSRKIVGYSFGKNMTTKFVIKALENTYHTQRSDERLIFHSDLGTQYTSKEFNNLIDQLNLAHSFSYKSSPCDYTCIESFHAILKKKEVNHVGYLDYESAELALFQYNDDWYNRKRIHGNIDYRTPQKMKTFTSEIA